MEVFIMAITKSLYGTINDKDVSAYVIENKNGTKAQIIEKGATLDKLFVKDASGNLIDVLVGHDTLDGHVNRSDYQGVVVGQYANRIKDGKFTIDGTEWACIKGGWISMKYVYVDGTQGEGAGSGTVNADAVNVRSGPGTKYNAVGSKNNGNPVTVYAQFQIGDITWGCIGNGQWIAMQYVNMG